MEENENYLELKEKIENIEEDERTQNEYKVSTSSTVLVELIVIQC